MLRGVELDDTVFKSRVCRRLATMIGTVRSDGNDCFHLPSAGGGADGHEGLSRQRLSRGDRGARQALLNELCLFVKRINPHGLGVVEPAVDDRSEFQGSNGAAADERKLRQRGLVFFVEAFLGEPLVKEGVSPPVRKGIRQEGRKTLIDLRFPESGNADGGRLHRLWMCDGCEVIRLGKILRREPEGAGLRPRIPRKHTDVCSPKGDRDHLGVTVAPCCHVLRVFCS